ncbi:MAG: ATP-binding cassette domain-containing protein [Paraglaciecola sp.]|uniref:ATP-binding cassette domain-containing protein n=1 Tax=Paraglaciecola sp. TaxID=1920173 RepID=UPI003298EBFD
MPNTIVKLSNVSQFFGSVIALQDINIEIYPAEVHCLLGDNGAGKSTLIKILAGIYQPSQGEVRFEDQAVRLKSAKQALDLGIATVYQDLALVPLMSISRNFFMGREITKGWGPLRYFDVTTADRIAMTGLAEMGIQVRDPKQLVGTMSGGEQQCLAIARAIYFGAKVLILDEPTAALGVKQSAIVLKVIAKARSRGLAVIFITHNVHHAYPVADKFTLLNRGRSLGTYQKQNIAREEVLEMMSGSAELAEMESDMNEYERDSTTKNCPSLSEASPNDN